MISVSLSIPDDLSFQMVYRQVRAGPLDVSSEGFDFFHLTSFGEGLRHRNLLAQRFGIPGTMKALAKLCTGRRSLYLAVAGSEVVSDGWCTLGRCAHYYIEPTAAVIGPIWTSNNFRARGIATRVLKMAMNELHGAGVSIFYIDTEKTNAPAQRVFEKCGFGLPLAVFIRPKNRAL